MQMNESMRFRGDDTLGRGRAETVRRGGRTKVFNALTIIELLVFFGLSIFAATQWNDDTVKSGFLHLCTIAGFYCMIGIAVVCLMKIIYRKRITRMKMTLMEILVCTVFVGIVICGIISRDEETIKYTTIYSCAVLGIASMLRDAVLLAGKLIRKEKIASVKNLFQLLICMVFVVFLIYSAVHWEDEAMRYGTLCCFAFWGVISMLHNIYVSAMKLFSRKHNGNSEDGYFRLSENEIILMKKEIETLTGRLEETNKNKEELERMLDETNKNKEELCRQLTETSRNRAELELQLEETNKDKDKLERQLEETNKNKDELECRLKETDKNLNAIERQLEERKADKNIAIEIHKREEIRRDAQRREMLNTKSYSVAKARLEENKPISEKDWVSMEKELGELFREFKSTLYEAHRLTNLEYRICWLVKMDFKNIEISILVSRAPNAVSLSRKRLYSKITGKEGTASDFDALIKDI